MTYYDIRKTAIKTKCNINNLIIATPLHPHPLIYWGMGILKNHRRGIIFLLNPFNT